MKPSVFRLCSYFYFATPYSIGSYGLNDEIRAAFKYYAQELFAQEELTGYLKDLLASEKSVYEQVVYDSAGVERTFAEDLEKNTAVKVYAKLPGWFKVPTPLGTYDPDWAILVEKNGNERLFFVVETKGSLFMDDWRGTEGAKIACGKAHFEALEVYEAPAEYVVTRTADDFMARRRRCWSRRTVCGPEPENFGQLVTAFGC